MRSRIDGVTIGVTGHRFLAEPDRLRAGVERAVRGLELAFPARWTVVSALAEGADRLLADRLLAREGSVLVAVLPLPHEDYATDFAAPESRMEFEWLLARAHRVVEVPGHRDRDEAYEAGGVVVLDLSTVLVALWDGRGAQGRGGTGGVVAEARARGMPLVWIHAGNRAPHTQVATSLGPEQGQVSFERLPRPPTGPPH